MQELSFGQQIDPVKTFTNYENGSRVLLSTTIFITVYINNKILFTLCLRGFTKLKKFQKSLKKTWIELNPPTHPPIQIKKKLETHQ